VLWERCGGRDSSGTRAKAKEPSVASRRMSVAACLDASAWPAGGPLRPLREATTCPGGSGREALYLAARAKKIPSTPAHGDVHACPTCDGQGTVGRRLPLQATPCDQCGGRSVVAPIGRQHLVASRKRSESSPDGWARAGSLQKPTAKVLGL
jgi:hypothetical protein